MPLIALIRPWCTDGSFQDMDYDESVHFKAPYARPADLTRFVSPI